MVNRISMVAVFFHDLQKLIPVIIIFLCLGPALICAEESIPKLDAYLDKDPLAVGEEGILTIDITWEGDASAYEFFFPELGEIQLLEVVGSAQKSSSCLRGDVLHQIHSFLFKLKGREKGVGKVGEIKVAYRRRGREGIFTLKTVPREVKVTSGIGKFFPWFARRPLVELIAGAGAVLVTIYIIRLIRRSRRPLAEPVADNGHHLEEKALRELGSARKLQVEGDREGFYKKLWEVLAGYLHRKFSIAISRDNWVQVVKDSSRLPLSEKLRSELDGILKLLERASFGSSSGNGADQEVLLKKVASFIRGQKD